MSRHETKFYLKTLIVVLFLIIVFGYAAFEVWNYATGPKITVVTPVTGAVVLESLVNIEGRVQNVKKITLNDRAIVIDESGNFTEKILLSYGYNVLTLEAQDRFGKETSQELQLVYK